MTDDRARNRAGLLYGLAAYLVWGLFPIYFKALANVLPTELVAHRILWSVLLLAALIALWGKAAEVRSAASQPRLLAMLTLTAVLIAINWLAYIWAVLHGHVLAASLGYYLNPLVNVLLGTLLLKERLSRPQIGAVALAAIGVAVLAVGAREGLWISLTLAFSFSLYGFFRKITPVDALAGLSIETAVLAPVALGWVLWLGAQDRSGFGSDTRTTILLVLAGGVTAVPLLWFNAAAKRLAYSTLGILQYITPSLQFLIAVWLFGERLTPAHMLCFAAIWTALVIFAWEGVRLGRASAVRA